MAISPLLLLAVAVSPQEPAPVGLLAESPDQALPPLAVLGLGDGGIAAAPSGPSASAPGDATTAGGVRVRVRNEGVKLDFPSGAEVLVTPQGRLCLRDGSTTLPAHGRLELRLADGATIHVEPDGNGRRPLRRVEIDAVGASRVLWPLHGGGRPRAAALSSRPQVLLLLGDGQWCYRPVPWGPLLLLRRVLAPTTATAPPARVVVHGGALAASLRALPGRLPPEPVQFPQAPEAARRLAAMAGELFGRSRERPVHSRGSLALPLAGDWRLEIELAGDQPVLSVGLMRADSSVPAVEWVTRGGSTVLQLLRPTGGAGGGPRYFSRGVDLSAELRAAYPGTATLDDRRWAEAVLRDLGAGELQGARPHPAAAGR